MNPRTQELLTQIEQLSAQNRVERSPKVELQLVELRRKSADLLISSGQKTEPRTSAPDLFPKIRTIPEIQGEELSYESLSAAILNHGALLVRGLFSHQHIARLRNKLGSIPEKTQSNNLNLGCSPGTLFELLEVYRDSGLLTSVRKYLHDEPVLFAERVKLRHHRAETDKSASIPWHQDVNFFGNKAYGINCWAAVTSCGETNPGLAIIPRRTELRHGWSGEGLAPLDYGRSLPTGMIEELARDYPIEKPILEPGDALLFDEMTIHRTNPRPWQQKEQVVAISWFFAASRFPSWGTPLIL